MKTSHIIFQNRLRDVRMERHISQAKLADMVGVSRQTIFSIEKCQFCPSAKLALLICSALDTPFDDIFYLETKEGNE